MSEAPEIADQSALSRGFPALALFVAALALRPSIVGVAPLAPDIAADLGGSHLYVSLLTAIPIVCMGLFAPLGPLAAHRLGVRGAMSAALLAVAVGGALRGILTAPISILALTCVVGVGTGAAGSLPPLVAKLRSGSTRIARATGAAAVGTVGSAMIAASVAVPVAALLGGWRPALLAFGAFGMLPLIGWLVLFGESGSASVEARLQVGWSAPRQRLGWLLAIAFGLQAILYWAASAWLPGAYVERGWPAVAAGGLVGLLNLSALASTLVMTALSDRLGMRLRQILGSSVAASVAMTGFALAPSLGLAWTLLLGAALGWIFPGLLAYTADVASDAADAGSLSGAMLLGGYLIAALGPTVLGFARDLTGSFVVPFRLLLLVGLALIVVVLSLVRRHSSPMPV